MTLPEMRKAGCRTLRGVAHDALGVLSAKGGFPGSFGAGLSWLEMTPASNDTLVATNSLVTTAG